MTDSNSVRVERDGGNGAGPVALLIPAFNPGPELPILVKSLAAGPFAQIYLVNDGSSPAHDSVFQSAAGFEKVTIIRHAVNLGKGAALKTGFNQALVEFPDLAGIVTADADGQHRPHDILHVTAEFLQSPGALVLGARTFAGDVPLRSRLGNSITHTVMRVVAGQKLGDTQTGLRAVPRRLAETMLSVPANGYEFELEMLIAAKHLGFPVLEQPIATVYEPGNPTSHFEPLRDSMRIYFVLLRFSFISLLSAGIDNFAFFLFFHELEAVAASLIAARLIAVVFNYLAVRRAVFLSREQHRIVLPRYLLLAAANVAFAWALITFLTSYAGFAVIPAKILVESLLFTANFAIQRDFIFARRSGTNGR